MCISLFAIELDVVYTCMLFSYRGTFRCGGVKLWRLGVDVDNSFNVCTHERCD